MRSKYKARSVYFICVGLMLFSVIALSMYIMRNGTIEESRIKSTQRADTYMETDNTADTVPIGIYTTSVFANLRVDENYSPLKVLGISMVSTAVLILTLIYLVTLMIIRVKDYSKMLLAATVFLIMRMFSVDLAVVLTTFFGGSFSSCVSVLFYGSTALSCFFLVAAVDQFIQSQSRVNKKRLTIIGIYYLVILIVIRLVMANPDTFFLEQHIRIIMLYPLFWGILKLYAPAEKSALFIVPAIVGYTVIVTGLFVDTMYLSGWIPAEMFWYYPLSMCLLLLAMIDLYYQKVIFARQQETIEINRIKNELEEKSVNLMMSQIQPHFLYNTLQAIQVLCRKDHIAAQETVMKFSEYLRTSMDFVEMKEVIPFLDCLKHVQCYVDIEQIRFQERLKMIYEIDFTDFSMPPLSIQPLVENAIKHGVCKKPEGGTVILRTRREKNTVVIEVIDDGIGFDIDILKDEFRRSKGIKNVQFRLEHMIGAKLTITSTPEEGTHQQVVIPDFFEKEE